MLEQGNDIFLQLPEHKLEQWQPLLNLIVQQFIQHFEQRPEQNKLPILMMLDEFPRLGRMESILHGLATLRSKKITFCIIIQSLAQLDDTYDTNKRKIICDNCSYKAILGAGDTETQKYFSQLAGKEDVKKVTHSRSNSMWGNKEPTISESTELRDRIPPEQFGSLHDIILFYRNRLSPYYMYLPWRGCQQGMVWLSYCTP